MKFSKKLMFISIAVLLLAGCTSNDEVSKEEEMHLKVGLMPAVDSAPIFLAEERGYFEDLGLQVELQVYTNANNRQSALQSGNLDGTMTDLISFVNNINNGLDIKIASSTDGSFPFLVTDNYEEKDMKKVGLMEISVSNYLTDESISDLYTIEKIFIPEIPTRLEMIKNKKLDMAVIPEPLASMGELSGLKKLTFEIEDDYTPEAMVFTGKALSNKDEAIALFFKAYDQAVAAIQKDDAVARDVLIKKLQLKPDIKDLILLPDYRKTRVPSRDYMNKIITWIEKVQNEKIEIDYDTMIEGKYVNP